MLEVVLGEGCGRSAPREQVCGPYASVLLTAYSVQVRGRPGDAWRPLLECRPDGLWMFKDVRPGLYPLVLVRDAAGGVKEVIRNLPAPAKRPAPARPTPADGPHTS